MTTTAPESSLRFDELNLAPSVLKALKDVGYETPSPIQAATIPLLLDNRDVLGQAQTGTGKTAAFALPILSRIDLNQKTPQALVLAPTRELAIQVAEAFQAYAKYIKGFHVMPIYGGQSYHVQLTALKRGVHVVVGTPGRIIDHIEKGSLNLSQIQTLVLDEADEMLRMGFIDDVERILQETPSSRQTTLFSATMPSAIKRIAQTYLNEAEEITIASKTTTSKNINQRYWLVSGMHKLDALTRILEAEEFDGMIIFTRTKLATEELADKLSARGFSVAAINGDMQQTSRERTINQLKDGKIDILVATDVAARGLDVDRISHVINYDVPYDAESYTHRIGRTGRAGRKGEAILFITPREKNLLKMIERTTKQAVSPFEMPTITVVNNVRISRFKNQIVDIIEQGDDEELAQYTQILESLENEHNIPMLEIAAALAKIARGNEPLLLDKNRKTKEVLPANAAEIERIAKQRLQEEGMQTFAVAVGREHGVKPGSLVGAIANEIHIDGKKIGRIDIYDEFTLLDLPNNLNADALEHLKTVKVAGHFLKIRAVGHINESTDTESSSPSSTKKKTSASQRSFSKMELLQESIEQSFDATDKKSTRKIKDAQAIQEIKKIRADKEVRDSNGENKKPKNKAVGKVSVAMHTYRLEVGKQDDVSAGNIVGAIANETGLDSQYIGSIQINRDHSLVDLPQNMPKEIFNHLKKVRVGGKPLDLSLIGEGELVMNAHNPMTKRGQEPSFEGKRSGAKRRVEDKIEKIKKRK